MLRYATKEKSLFKLALNERFPFPVHAHFRNHWRSIKSPGANPIEIETNESCNSNIAMRFGFRIKGLCPAVF